jgi:SNF2 family DNA or RNA helicase
VATLFVSASTPGNHPSCLESTTAVLDADIDASSADEDYDNNDEDESSDSNGVRRRKKKKQKKSNSEAAGAKAAAAAADDSDGAPWYGDLLSASSGYRPGRVEDSGKLLLCVFLLASAFRVREKVLIFSQSLDMLDLLENVLQSFFGLRSDKGYHRLDGQNPIIFQRTD